MTKSQISLLGSLLASGALVFAGCGGGSSSGTGGATGSGGRGTGGLTGGTGGAGTGGRVDAGTDTVTDTGTPTDTGGGDTAPCTTSIGAGNLLLFPFDNGSITGWETQHTDPADAGLVPTIAGTTTDGNLCKGAGVLTAPFTAYGGTGNTETAQIDYQFFSNGGPRSFVGYSKLHMSVKVVAADFGALAAIQPFVGLVSNATPMTYPYLGQYTGGISSSVWREFVIDLSAYSSADFKMGNLGAQLQLQQTAPSTGPAAPSTMELLIDDVWLEAAPASDAGTDSAVDTATDVAAPTDTAGDATSG